MGAANDFLIPLAVLWDNPQGLTKEEIIDIFQNKIHIKKDFTGCYHYLKSGLYGMATLFNINYSEEYKESFKESHNKEYKYFAKYADVISCFGEIHEKPIITYKEHEILKEMPFNLKGTFYNSIGNFNGHKFGEYLDEVDYYFIDLPKEIEENPGSVLRIKDIKTSTITELKPEKGESNHYKDFFIDEELILELVKFHTKQEKFNSIEDLCKKYPEFIPERMFNFNQDSGFLYPYNINARDRFKWIKKGEKYFLDKEQFSRVISGNGILGPRQGWKHKEKDKSGKEKFSRFSLTDLILTSEAIRRGKWEKLEYNGFRHGTEEFIYGNEETLRKYEQAIFDTEMSKLAQREKMTNFEFLRQHHFSQITRKQVPIEIINKGVKIEIEKRKKEIEKRKKEIEKWERENPNPSDNLPF